MNDDLDVGSSDDLTPMQKAAARSAAAVKVPRQVLYVSNRDIDVATKTGHSFNFKRGVPQHVPGVARAEVETYGIIPVEEKTEQVNDEIVVPNDPKERLEALFEAFKVVVKKNEREDFTGQGTPTAKAVQDIVKWKVPKDELTKAWGDFRASGLAG